MPPIKSISFDDGIKIDCEGLPSYWLKFADFPKVQSWMTPDAYGKMLTDLIQPTYEDKLLLSTLDPADPARQTPPILLTCERIEKISGKDTLITITMWVKVVVYSLSPLKYNIRCSSSPILDSEVF